MKPIYRKKSNIVQSIVFPTSEGACENKIHLVVSGYRKRSDVMAVKTQAEQSERAELSPYGQHLFESCFKHW